MIGVTSGEYKQRDGPSTIRCQLNSSPLLQQRSILRLLKLTDFFPIIRFHQHKKILVDISDELQGCSKFALS